MSLNMKFYLVLKTVL